MSTTTTTTTTSTSTTTTTTSTSSSSKSHVRELKRLFESKKVVVLDKLSSLKGSNRFNTNSSSGGGSTNNTGTVSKLINKANQLDSNIINYNNNNSGKGIGTKTISLSSSTTPVGNTETTTTSSIESSAEDKFEESQNELSQNDRKYYFYVNEAIRKNQPIVPSLAIRRKSLDLTHSPIKGSHYASIYQHTYSPTTRTIHLSRTNNRNYNGYNSNSNNVNNNNNNNNNNKFQPDTSWIKSNDIGVNNSNNQNNQNNNNVQDVTPFKLSEDDHIIGGSILQQSFSPPSASPSTSLTPNITSPPSLSSSSSLQKEDIQFRKLSITKSSFELNNSPSHNKPPVFGGGSPTIGSSKSKEEPIPKKSYTTSPTNSPSHSHLIYKTLGHHSKPIKLSLDDDIHLNSTSSFTLNNNNNNINNNNNNNHQISKKEEKEKKEEKKMFSWVSLRRIKRSNTSDHGVPTTSKQKSTTLAPSPLSNTSTSLLSDAIKSPSKNEGQAKSTSNSPPLSFDKHLKEDQINQFKSKTINIASPPKIVVSENKDIPSIKESTFFTNYSTGSLENVVPKFSVSNAKVLPPSSLTAPPSPVLSPLLSQSPNNESSITSDDDSSTSSSPSNSTTPKKQKSFISHSITILKKDLVSRGTVSTPSSPSSTPKSGSLLSLEDRQHIQQQQQQSRSSNNIGNVLNDSPVKRFISIAKPIQRVGSESIIKVNPISLSTPPSPHNEEQDSLSSSPSNIKQQQHKLHQQLQHQQRNISASDGNAEAPLISVSSGDEVKNNNIQSPAIPDVSSSKLLHPRLEALANTRVRSSSVGSIIETPRVEIADIPPLKVHITSLEECLTSFAKPNLGNGGSRVFMLDLANCALGDDGIQQLSESCPGGLEIADLSWNDITETGLQVFGEMIARTQSLVTSISLQGNQMSPTSLQTFLENINKVVPRNDRKPKGYVGFGLNLKETGIENEGADCLAAYIGENRFPPIIGLNLTYASVTDVGMSSFSSALVRNTHLTTLILDENYLGDDGAALLAEGLKFNKTLTHLQMRNTDIGESGTVALSNACKFNTTIATIDLSLNPWQLNGEIALESLLITKQMISKTQHRNLLIPKVIWKDEGMDMWDDDEITTIINHFGKEKIIDLLINGYSLSPLLGQENLFTHLNIETSHLTNIFKQIIHPTTDDSHLNSIKLLVQLLPTHLDNHIFLSSLTNHLSSLISVIDKPKKKVDYLLLNLLDFFKLLVQSNNQQLYEKFNDFSLFSKCFELYFEFPRNNILHQNIHSLMDATTTHQQFKDYELSIFSNENLGKVISYISVEFECEPGNRTPNYGHLLELTNLLKKHSTTHPYLQTREWKQYQAKVLESELQLQESYLCGFVPNRNMKIDTLLLDKFEKEFKK